MRIFIKHILRNIEDNIGRTLLMLLTLTGVGLILGAGIFIIIAMEFQLKDLNSSQYSYDYIITDIFYDEITLDTLDSFGYNNELNYYLFKNSNESYYINKKGKEIFINYTTVNSLDNKYMELFRLEKNDILNDDEIIIKERYQVYHRLKQNQYIELYNSEKEAKKFKIKYISGSTIFDDVGADIVVSQNTYTEFFKNKETPSTLAYAVYKGKEDIAKFTKEVSKLKYEKGYLFTRANLLSDDDLLMVNVYLIAIGILVMIIALVVIYYVMNSLVRTIMQERQPIVGSFRSVGASIKKMNFILLCEMGLYGTIGGILGSTLVSTILFSVLKNMEHGINFSSGGIIVLTIVLSTILLTLFQMLLSLNEILVFKDLSIKDCMFSKGDYKYKKTFKKLVLGIAFEIISIGTMLYAYQISYILGIISIGSSFIGITLLYPYVTELFKKIFNKINNPIIKMAIDNINSNKLQLSTNIIIIILTSISLVAVYYLNAEQIKITKKENLFTSDLYVSSSREDSDFERRIASLDEVKDVSSLYIKTISHEGMKIGGVEQSTSINIDTHLVTSSNVGNLIKDSNIIDTNKDSWVNLKANEVILSNYFKKKYKIKKGDIITIEFLDSIEKIEYEQYYNLKVVDFADTDLISPITMIVSEDVFNNEDTDDLNAHYFINLNENVNVKEASKKIKKELNNNLEEAIDHEKYKEQMNMEKKDNTYSIIEIIGVIILIGLIGIINNQTVAFLQRSRELAVLYSTCMSRKNLASMILKELLMSYSITSVISVALSLILSNLLTYACDTLAIVIDLKFNIIYTLILLLVIGLIMASLYVFIRINIKKLNIVEELKYE